MKNITKLLLAFLLSYPFVSNAQMDSKLVSLTIPKKLKEYANAVIRKNDIVVEIDDVDQVTITKDRIVTVFGEMGMNYVNAYQHYSDSWKIKDMEVVIYDALGKEITKVKERDFRDASTVAGGTLYADDRIKYLEYTPRSYPLTVHYTSKVVAKSTAFLPQWVPLEDFYCSTESSSIKVINTGQIPLKFKEMNFEGFGVKKTGELQYEAVNLPALKNEAFRPNFKDYAPRVKFAMKNFVMEGVPGVNNDWSDFGKWMYTDLLADTQELPETVRSEIIALTSNATTAIEKAKIIYQYVQDRSRYISVQVGIGGWKPIDASIVHKMAYGDCKGLTNYTMSLLQAVGIESHYAAIYGGSTKYSMDAGFSMTEGNHVILYLPELAGEKDYWLECTSKNAPFGFMGDFTDDRDALVITPSGGKLMHTTTYPTNENLQITTGNFKINKEGNVTGRIIMSTEGVQYAWRSDMGLQNALDLKKNYLKFWNHLNGLSVIEASTVTNKEIPQFEETVELQIQNYGSKSGDLLIFQPNILNRHDNEPPMYEDRKFDIEIDRGYIDEDHYVIELEEGLSVDALPKPVYLETKFGNYSLVFTAGDHASILVDRKVEMFAGLYDKSTYSDFREFKSNIVISDASRGVLKIKQ